MMKKTRSKGIWKRTALDGLFYLLGSVLYALSVNIFTAPNQIAPGGVTGVATLFNFAWGLPIGTMILVINLPLLIAPHVDQAQARPGQHPTEQGDQHPVPPEGGQKGRGGVDDDR